MIKYCLSSSVLLLNTWRAISQLQQKKSPCSSKKIREAWGYISLICKTRQCEKGNYPFRDAVTFLGYLRSERTVLESIAATVASSTPRATRRRRCAFTRWVLAPADFVGRLLLGLRSNVVLAIIVFRFVVKNWKNRLIDRLGLAPLRWFLDDQLSSVNWKSTLTASNSVPQPIKEGAVEIQNQPLSSTHQASSVLYWIFRWAATWRCAYGGRPLHFLWGQPTSQYALKGGGGDPL